MLFISFFAYSRFYDFIQTKLFSFFMNRSYTTKKNSPKKRRNTVPLEHKKYFSPFPFKTFERICLINI